ncbi:hypothetical protein B0H14DRAFT_3759037 [Mycena olivaceomarginata]|nr:hypothetical protein B0H14DRAFT_3759037 [Mycena olivaceomarginata]
MFSPWKFLLSPIPKSASTASFGYVIPNTLPNSSTPYLLPTESFPQTPNTPKNGVAGAMVKETKGAVIVEGIKTGLEAVGGMEVIEQGLNAFMEGMPVLMNALDEVAKLHPCGYGIQGRVGARAETSRERLKNTCVAYGDEGHDGRSDADPEEVAPDGTTIKGRMQEIAKGTADDIKACANVHLQSVRHIFKEKAGSQGLEGPIWEGKLVKFVGMFSKRRDQFELALSIHTSLGVDAANRAISTVDKTTQENIQFKGGNASLLRMKSVSVTLSQPKAYCARCYQVTLGTPRTRATTSSVHEVLEVFKPLLMLELPAAHPLQVSGGAPYLLGPQKVLPRTVATLPTFNNHSNQ